MNRSIELRVDRTACAGHGLCYGHAPDIVDSDDQGYPVVLVDTIPDGEVANAHAIVAMCPERALSVAESNESKGAEL